MDTLITTEDVISLAFSSVENYRADIINKADIVAAEQRFLLPIIGAALYERLLRGDYALLRTEYVAPQVAAWTRYIVEPLMPTRCFECHNEEVDNAEIVARNMALRNLRSVAHTLSCRLSDHLDAAPAEYPEYNPENNILKRCSIDGGIVQVY